MDRHRFDGLTRFLGARSHRRGGIGAALGAAIAFASTGPAADAAPARRPRAEGPCGDGARKANICARDRDCCTGICATSLANNDGAGRCRCVKRGMPCSEDRNCCAGRSCLGGVCAVPPRIPTGQPCAARRDVCADARASCTAFDADAQAVLGSPAGTRCLLPAGASDCGEPGIPDTICSGGYCAPGAVAGAPSICGGVRIVDACTAATDTGAGATVFVVRNVSYPPLGVAYCGVSQAAATPLIFTDQGSGAACTADDQCNLVPPGAAPAGSVCVRDSSLSSTLSLVGGSTGGYCRNGAFLCATQGDCPKFASLDPNPQCLQPAGVPVRICIYTPL